MNQLAQLYNNLGSQQYQPLSQSFMSWGQQPSRGGAGGQSSATTTPWMIGGSYQMQQPLGGNPNFLAGLNQAWNSGTGRALSGALGLGALRTGSNFLEGFNAAEGGFFGGVQNALSNLFGGGSTDAVARQRQFDAELAEVAQEMISRGIDPATGQPIDEAARAQQRAANNAARRADMMRNMSINSEIDSVARQMQYQNILEGRGGARQER